MQLLQPARDTGAVALCPDATGVLHAPAAVSGGPREIAMTLVRSTAHQLDSAAAGRHVEPAQDRDPAQLRQPTRTEQPAQPPPRDGWELLRGRRNSWYYRRSR